MFKHLYSEISKLTGHRVLCVGDIMLDRFVYGDVSRISPEAPIPVFHEQRTETTLGAGGNVVRNIVSLGGNVDVVVIVGNDHAGYELTEKIAAMQEVSPYILTDNSRPTIIKTRFVSSGQQLLRSDREDIKQISQRMEEEVLIRVKTAMTDCDVIVLSDYAKGLLTDRVISETIKLAKEKNKPVLIDTKGRDFTRYHGATLLTPNKKELSEATGVIINTVEDAEKAARLLIEQCDLGGVLAKLSEDGVCLVMKDEKASHFKADAREVFDVSGAGDTVVATMALAIAGELKYEDCAALANLAGTIVVGKIGTATVHQEELRAEVMHGQARFSEGKLITAEDAAEIAKHGRAHSQKIGFTNGIYDYLNPGHLASIRQARKACDFLIVGLNSDDSVQKEKGKDHPKNSEEERATVLAALADVDAVVIFNEDTPYDLIKTIQPDILAKGGDYTVEEVIGHKLLESWGGKVLLTSLMKND